MSIVIAGAGDVGTYLVESLSRDEHAISVIDTDVDKLTRLDDRYDVSVHVGNCLSYDNLSAVGVANADLYVAVTPSEELNLLSSVFAKRMGARKVVARIRHSKLLDHPEVFDFAGLGIDAALSPDAIAAEESALILTHPMFTDVIQDTARAYCVVGARLDESSVWVTDRYLAQATDGVVPFAYIRGDTVSAIGHSTQYESGDLVYFMVRHDALHALALTIAREDRAVSRVLIVGGSRVGIESARRLCQAGFSVEIVERDRAFAEDMAAFLPEVLVLHNDTRSPYFLDECALGPGTALIAATGDPEVNIISCLVAKERGATHTIALVKDERSPRLLATGGVDTSINKKLLAADLIARFAAPKQVRAIMTVPMIDYEVIDLTVRAGARDADRPIADTSLVQDTLGQPLMRMRDGVFVLLSETDVLCAGDRVLVACAAGKRPLCVAAL